MELRDYQLELAEAALDGKNSIVIAPTGSGKTRVAVYVTLKVLRAEPNAKVAFLVPTANLAEQQSEAFKRDLPNGWGNKVCYIHGGKENAKRMPFDQAFKQYSVLVVTTQILLNQLNRSSKKYTNGPQEPTIDITAFRLIVLDECHSCLESHASRQVMLKYMQMKLSLLRSEESAQQRKRLPQILGLTASPGTGKAGTQDGALDHLVKLCGNLDSVHPVTVQRCRESLDNVTTKPDCNMHLVGEKQNDRFSELIGKLMERGEELLKGYRNQMPECDMKILLASIPKKGTTSYSSFCYTIKYSIHKVDESSSKNLNACRRYLGCCNKALMISQFFRSKDALAHLEQELRRESEMRVDAACEADEDLRQKLSDLMPHVLRLCESDREAGVSAPLEKLVQILNSQFAERPDSRAVVFVEEKFYATVLAEYLSETLPATFVTGGTSSTAEGGTKANVQRKRLEDFKSGKYKVLAATSVIELGVDVPACNLVVRYCHVTNEISMIQCMGRGRAKDSSYHVIVADSQEGLEEKERINRLRHAMTLQAVAQLTEMDLETRRKRIEQHQTIWMKNAATAVKAPTEYPDARSDAHDVVCNNCHEPFTESSRLRLIEGKHHVALDKDLLSGRLTGKSGESVQVGKLFEKVGVDLECGCGIQVAKVVHYRNLFFPLVSINKVLFRCKDTGEYEKPVSAWNKTAEFLKVAALSPEESKTWHRNLGRLPATLREFLPRSQEDQ